MYNLRDYSNNYSKTSESLWKYYREESPLTILVISNIFMLMIKTVLHLNLNKIQHV